MLDTALERALFDQTPIWAAGAQDWWDFTRSGRAKRGVGAMPVETRASDGWVENEAGLLVKRSANTRSMAGKGLLTFPTAQNFVTAPSDLADASWTKDSCTPTVNGAVGPFGTTTMDKICEISGTVTPFVRNYAFTTVTSGQRYVIYGYAKASERSLVAINFAGSGFATYNRAFFDLTTGTITQVGLDGNVQSGMTRLGNDIWLIWHSTIAGATAGGGFQLGMAKSSASPSYAGTPGEGLYVEGFNMRLGAFPVPPIDSAATANGPQQVIDLGDRAALGVGFIFDATILETSSTFSRLIEISDGTGNNVVNAYIGSASNNLVFGVASGGVVSVSMNVTTTALATGRMVLAGVAGENYAVARVVGQSAPTPDTTVTFPTTLSKVNLLGRGSDAVRNSYGYTNRLALWYGPMSAHFFDNVLWPKAQLLAQVA